MPCAGQSPKECKRLHKLLQHTQRRTQSIPVKADHQQTLFSPRGGGAPFQKGVCLLAILTFRSSCSRILQNEKPADSLLQEAECAKLPCQKLLQSALLRLLPAGPVMQQFCSSRRKAWHRTEPALWPAPLVLSITAKEPSLICISLDISGRLEHF